MKRLIARAIVACSTLATLALALLWVRSHYVLDEISRVDDLGMLHGVVSFDGSIHVIETNTLSAPRRLSWDANPYRGEASLGPMYDPGPGRWSFAGFMTLRRTRGDTFLSDSVPIAPWLFGAVFSAWVVPYWAPTLLASIPALVALTRWTRRVVRRRRGLCAECGYDIRATAVRCPECGGAIGVSPATAGAA